MNKLVLVFVDDPNVAVAAEVCGTIDPKTFVVVLTVLLPKPALDDDRADCPV